MSKVVVRIMNNEALIIGDYSSDVDLEIKSMLSKVLGEHQEDPKNGMFALGEMWTQHTSHAAVIDVFFDEGFGYEIRCKNEKVFNSCLSFVDESKLFTLLSNT